MNLVSTHAVDGARLPVKQESKYLGVTINDRGVTASKLLQRIAVSRGLLFRLRRTIQGWTTTVKQRQLIA